MSSINDMLEELRTGRQSIINQIEVLNDIIDKSNNVLLQIESECTRESKDFSNLEAYSFKKETEHSLARAIELYQHLPENKDDVGETLQSDLGFSEYLHENCQNLQIHNSNVRKLLVVGEIMSKVAEKTPSKEIDTFE